MKVLVLGAAGQLGRALERLCPLHVEWIGWGRGELDLAHHEAIESAIARARPTVLINAAAYTAVDRAESERATAFAVNAEAPGILAGMAKAHGIRLIHLSTDYVFAGDRGRPWRVDDQPNPVNVYGASKAEGERRIRAIAPDHTLIVRSGWVYAPWGHNFFCTILRLLGEREALQVIDDQIGTPTSALSLARFLWTVVEQSDLTGIDHWSDAGVASWYDFACAIQEEARAQGLLTRSIPIHPIPTTAYPLPASRPAQSVLDKTWTMARTGQEPVHWRSALREVVEARRRSSVTE